LASVLLPRSIILSPSSICPSISARKISTHFKLLLLYFFWHFTIAYLKLLNLHYCVSLGVSVCARPDCAVSLPWIAQCKYF
jgi:hypothetical protein